MIEAFDEPNEFENIQMSPLATAGAKLTDFDAEVKVAFKIDSPSVYFSDYRDVLCEESKEAEERSFKMRPQVFDPFFRQQATTICGVSALDESTRGISTRGGPELFQESLSLNSSAPRGPALSASTLSDRGRTAADYSAWMESLIPARNSC